jgi:hypothetical protein
MQANGKENEMSPAFARRLTTAPGASSERPGIDQQDSRLSVIVISTSVDATIVALKRAGRLAESLGAQITLLVPQVVPYPLPLTSPPVLLDFQERHFREIASESPVEIQMRLYLCRDALQTLKAVLDAHSLIVVGGQRRWWPTREESLARKLRRMGHEVIFTETD